MVDKDAAIDRLLRQATRPQDAAVPEGCPDAEQLAAFVSGSLRTVERDACEAHIAACARCLPLVATLARTGEAPAHGTAWWRPARWTWWLVPATAVATAVALWVNVAPDREPAERESAPTAVDQRAAADAAPVVAPPAEGNAAPQQKAATTSEAPATAKEARKNALEAGARDFESKRKIDPRRESPREEKAPTAPPAAAGRGAVPPPAARPDATPRATPAPPAAPVTSVVPGAPSQAQERARASADRLTSLYRSDGRMQIASPDPSVRWRISGPTIERSGDGGSTWTAQFTAAQPLAAGAAPSATVAWIVGRGGTVLLTTDGQQWQRTPFPEAVDLVAVRARNQREADVSTVDGRVFRTADGGNTWTLQESPPHPF